MGSPLLLDRGLEHRLDLAHCRGGALLVRVDRARVRARVRVRVRVRARRPFLRAPQRRIGA